jgi:broad specificity phosphatase PhoE
MPALFLIKHAMPEIDPSVPAKRWSLGAEGQRQARELAGVFSPQPEVVVSRTEPKAVQTGQLIAKRTQAALFEPDPRLCEHERSEVGFLGREAFQNAVAQFFRTPHRLVFGCETADQARAL